MYKLILLDRDGVINQDLPTGVLRLEDFKMLPHVQEAIALLNQAGYQTALVTNQACVGRGDMTLETLNGIHSNLQESLKTCGGHLDRIYVCTDTGLEPSTRRKPAPGMLLEAMADFNVLPSETVMIGDDLRDLQAAKAADCDSILVKTGKGQKTLDHQLLQDNSPVLIAENLLDAVHWITKPK